MHDPTAFDPYPYPVNPSPPMPYNAANTTCGIVPAADNPDTPEPFVPNRFWQMCNRNSGRSEGEQPLSDLTHELQDWERQTWEKQQDGQHMRLLCHSEAVHIDRAQGERNRGRRLVGILMLLAIISFFGAIALTIVSTFIHLF